MQTLASISLPEIKFAVSQSLVPTYVQTSEQDEMNEYNRRMEFAKGLVKDGADRHLHAKQVVNQPQLIRPLRCEDRLIELFFIELATTY